MFHFLDRFEEALSSFLLALMVVTSILQVFFRYCVSYSLDWPEEMGRYLCIALGYIGSGYAERENKHLSITILRTSGGAWCAKYLPLLALGVTAAFCGMMTVWGVNMAYFVWQTGQVAPAMQFPMWIVYACLPLGMACMGIRALIKFFRRLSLNRPQGSQER